MKEQTKTFNYNLVNFLSGQSVIQIDSAEEMAHFVDWLNKYDIYDILVGNQQYRKEYAKISFWKKLRQEHRTGWIRPTTPIWFAYICGRLCWFGTRDEIRNEFGGFSCVVKGGTL